MRSISTTRRNLLIKTAVLAAPFGGCSMGIATKSVESKERHTFLQKAMIQVQQEAAAQDEEQRRRGSGAALQVATLTPFGDWDYYFIKGGPIIWRPNPGQTFKAVNVPEGFVTDLASVPRAFWEIMRPEGRYAYAAVVHDYLYWMQDRSKEEADKIFRFAMEDAKVDATKISTLYSAVDLLGRSAWENNRKLKESGERRILKKFPTDFTTSWAEWKSQPDIFR
jgi:uncharacterized pyridoxamine 5'-phosphate oxidase family protein